MATPLPSLCNEVLTRHPSCSFHLLSYAPRELTCLTHYPQTPRDEAVRGSRDILHLFLPLRAQARIRDIKPDNILLDEHGHAHLTDFNIAAIVKDDLKATSMAGTKPYMAPELFQPFEGSHPGYSFAVDWWSLGITSYELLRGQRPYVMGCSSSSSEILQSFHRVLPCYPATWSAELKSLLGKLLCIDAQKRLSSLTELQKLNYLSGVSWDAILSKQVPPGFTPNRRRLNCDPTFELEEMILEAKPLHKKKKRLARKSRENGSEGSPQNDRLQQRLDVVQRDFIVFNREKLRKTKRDAEANDVLRKETSQAIEDGQNNNLTEARSSKDTPASYADLPLPSLVDLRL
ncbi:hypothetical protein P4O66_002944 [Electrophorus voltai]|uniref:Protein kinase domain-containing protein n=1 Tax=Electrophorus voltai TaxID=2609070 RepID=A0AAD8YU90_9TELE|nr:hypothetical protein P4O66_002944 [Electrophorus voltai]